MRPVITIGGTSPFPHKQIFEFSIGVPPPPPPIKNLMPLQIRQICKAPDTYGACVNLL